MVRALCLIEAHAAREDEIGTGEEFPFQPDEFGWSVFERR